ncbi:MAG: acetate kinase, partial [Acidobacteriales bacterium]|nr:acetate kinase [Terriglobales bacterium]
DATGAKVVQHEVPARDHAEAFRHAMRGQTVFAAVGHRVVHGGPRLTQHQRITPEVIEQLRDSVHFAPLHIPATLAMIAEVESTSPGVPQFACFDTAFHSTMPEQASRFALPSELWDRGVRRYGFHGLSCESVVHALGDALPSRLVIAHLGSGASITAVRDGKSMDTSMGLTPTGGIVMSSRSGDLDPGVLLFLMRAEQLDSEKLEQLLNKESGLMALAGSPSMKDVDGRANQGDADAQLAIEIFCRTVAKFVAGYASVLGGLDMLVFTGGIGEHSESIRTDIIERLCCCGAFETKVMTAEEDMQIARHCRRLLGQASQ